VVGVIDHVYRLVIVTVSFQFKMPTIIRVKDRKGQKCKNELHDLYHTPIRLLVASKLALEIANPCRSR